MTRSFGDYHLKKFVISEPEISKYQIKDNDRYIVMASDGFWDVSIIFNLRNFLKPLSNKFYRKLTHKKMLPNSYINQSKMIILETT